MAKLIVPRHTADLEYIIPAMQVFYEGNDWITISDYKNKLFAILLENRKESKRNSDETHYTKCSEIPRYFGFLEREEPGKSTSRIKITQLGKEFYEAFLSNDDAKVHRTIIKSLKTISFGRNNEGCGSDTDYEAPNVVIIASLLINGLTNKEAAYILDCLVNKNQKFYTSLLSVKLARERGLKFEHSGVTTDIKFIPFLKRINFLDENIEGRIVVAESVKSNYYNELISLKITNDLKTNNTSNGITDDIVYIANSYNEYMPAMRTKPFLLIAGISGTGKSRIVKEMAFDSCAIDLREDVSPGNFCMIEVKPNWHDSSELMGYVSRIGGNHYVVTPFLNFLIKAMHHKETPFFVCLDEMNLAPVEQYFAEFLSVLESRKSVNGNIVSEPLIKAEVIRDYIKDFKNAYYGATKTDSYVGDRLTDEPSIEYESAVFAEIKEYGIILPPNVIVIGTINMDDTTYQFSRKVIDRAMTIEMNTVDFNSIFSDDHKKLEYPSTPASAELYLPNHTSAIDVLSSNEISDKDKDFLKENLPKVLSDLNSILKNTPFRIAYRVENELVLYFSTLRKYDAETTSKTLFETSIDDILMMKVLPRIEGNEDLLEEPLNNLHTFAENKYPKATIKIEEMQERLHVNHFTSFWP